jgi:HAD superfamily hydrolase (TIGR01509 family)
MAELKNIIFDLGGVLLDIDYKKTEDAFIRLGYDNFHAMYSQFTADELFRKLETGKISNEEFYEVLVRAHAGSVTKEEINWAWNKMLLGWREKSLLFLEQVSSKYKIYLLSNTNAIHFEAFHRSLKQQTGRNAIDPLFIKAYWSHIINLRKPGAEVFEFLIKDAGFIPAETLLVDDSVNNIDAAAALGFKTKLLLPGEFVEDIRYDLV